MDELEKKAADIQAELKANKDGLEKATADLKEATEKGEKSAKEIAEMAVEVKSLKDSLEEKTKALDEAINTLNTEVKKKGEMKQEGTDFITEFKRVFESPEFQAQVKDVISKKRASTEAFEVKDNAGILTSYATNPVSRTVAPGPIYSLGYEPNKFLAAFGTAITIPQDKNRASWFDGTYSSNVGYVEEMTALTTADTALIEEKYREIGKVGARLPFSAESVADTSYFVNWAKTEGVAAVLSYLDTLLWSGEGADGGAYVKKIYGLKYQGATAFNAATAVLTSGIQAANVADLILACKTQINIQSKGRYEGNLVFIHPANVTLMQTIKDNNKNYIAILPNGTQTIHGCMIAATSKVGIDELCVVDTNTLQLHQKGGMEMEIARYANTDSFELYIRWRGQEVVPTYPKLGNVYCSSIVTALAAINAAGPVQDVHITNSPLEVINVSTTTTTTAAVTTTTTAA